MPPGSDVCSKRWPPGFLAIDRLLWYFAATRPAARARYRELVESEQPAPALAHPLIDGDSEFVLAHLRRINASVEHARDHVQPPRRDLSELLAPTADAAAIADAHREHGHSMRQIATHLGCGVATISRRIRAHETSPTNADGTRKT